MTSPRCDQTVAWAALGGHYQAHGADLDLRTLFADDPRRVEALTFEAPEVVVDMSRVHWDVATRHHLLDLARECRLTERRDAMLRGELVNGSEGRAVLHTALRAPRGQGPFSDEVHAVLLLHPGVQEHVHGLPGDRARLVASRREADAQGHLQPGRQVLPRMPLDGQPPMILDFATSAATDWRAYSVSATTDS